jgi:hypothetical protein
MSWDSRGRYYYRSRREGRLVRREYVGAGAVAQLAARLDEQDRHEREEQNARQRAQLHAEQARWRPLDDQAREVCRTVEALARLALIVAGYHQHARGHWRKRKTNG